jgi:hypothetical protein
MELQPSDVERVYEQAKAQYPNVYESISFDQWLNYLTGGKLIESKQGKWTLTTLGREFLKWRIDAARIGPLLY